MPTPRTGEPADRWQTVDRQLLVDRSPFARIYDDVVQLPGGETIANFVRVELPDFVIVCAVTDDNRIPIVRQYRHAAEAYTLECPAGHIEDDEEPLVAAQRELREEAGVEAGHWQFLGRYMMDANRHCGFCYAYLARGARQIAQPDDGDLGEMTVRLLPFEEVRRLLEAGDFIVAPTTLCLGLAMNALGHETDR